MKTAIKTLLAILRLAPATQVEHLTDQARRSAARVSELEERTAKLRADIETWKQHYENSAKTVAEWKHAAAAAIAKAERAAADTERAEALKAQLHALRERLGNANHATTMAREHLMATEVKLDLIEAAIQVLDARTRETAVRS